MLGALAAYFINADPPLPRCFWRCFVDSEKMTFLDFFEIYLIILVVFGQQMFMFIEHMDIFC